MCLDALNFMLTLDNKLGDATDDLAPYKSAHDSEKPYTISGDLSVPKPVVSTISNWMHSEDINLDINTDTEFMKSIAC